MTSPSSEFIRQPGKKAESKTESWATRVARAMKEAVGLKQEVMTDIATAKTMAEKISAQAEFQRLEQLQSKAAVVSGEYIEDLSSLAEPVEEGLSDLEKADPVSAANEMFDAVIAGQEYSAKKLEELLAIPSAVEQMTRLVEGHAATVATEIPCVFNKVGQLTGLIAKEKTLLDAAVKGVANGRKIGEKVARRFLSNPEYRERLSRFQEQLHQRLGGDDGPRLCSQTSVEQLVVMAETFGEDIVEFSRMINLKKFEEEMREAALKEPEQGGEPRERKITGFSMAYAKPKGAKEYEDFIRLTQYGSCDYADDGAFDPDRQGKIVIHAGTNYLAKMETTGTDGVKAEQTRNALIERAIEFVPAMRLGKPAHEVRVNHSEFQVPKEATGNGIATKLLHDSLEMYVRKQFTQVDMIAQHEVGGYCWPTYGFDWNRDGMNPDMIINAIADMRDRVKNAFIDADLIVMDEKRNDMPADESVARVLAYYDGLIADLEKQKETPDAFHPPSMQELAAFGAQNGPRLYSVYVKRGDDEVRERYATEEQYKKLLSARSEDTQVWMNPFKKGAMHAGKIAALDGCYYASMELDPDGLSADRDPDGRGLARAKKKFAQSGNPLRTE